MNLKDIGYGETVELLSKEDSLLSVDNSSYRVHIILTTYNRLDLLKQCLESLFSNTDPEVYKLWVMESGSVDGTKKYLSNLSHESLESVYLCQHQVAQHDQINRGWGLIKQYVGFNNFPYLNFIVKAEDDILFSEHWLDYLLTAWFKFSPFFNLGMIGGYEGKAYEDNMMVFDIAGKPFRITNHTTAPLMFTSYYIFNEIMPIPYRSRNDPPGNSTASAMDYYWNLFSNRSIMAMGKRNGTLRFLVKHLGKGRSTWR